MGESRLTIRLLGEMRVLRGGEPVNLPQSKKTRALLAWLVMHDKAQRRDRLCELLWDVADDPRGALRWCLSKVRPLVNEDGHERIHATRSEVSFKPDGAVIDLLQLKERIEAGLADLPVEALKELAAQFRGEFLEGVDFTEFLDFHAWCTQQRELARRLHVKLLNELVARKQDNAEKALPHARMLAQIDALNPGAHAKLIRLLVAADRRREAEQQLESAKRLLAELDQPLGDELKHALDAPAPVQRAAPAPGKGDTRLHTPLVGRDEELVRLDKLIESVRDKRRAGGVLLQGDPGLGKSRLVDEFARRLEKTGATVLHGKSFELEQDRPYGPWIDALGRLSKHFIGKETADELAPLLGRAGTENSSREKLFGAVSELIAARAGSAPLVALLFDDVQWLDGASVELIHYAVRTNRHRPLLLVFAARPGELPDNDAALRLVRGLGRDGVLRERELPPLAESDVASLVRAVAPKADVEAIFKDSAGNPLFAMELARASGQDGELPESIVGAIRERTESLPGEAADMLRWGAICGCYFSVELLGELADIEPDELVESLETLERHALMHSVPDSRTPLGAYAFPHEIIRRAIYDELSEPRKRLMHLKVANTLRKREDPDGSIAADVAHHASLGGDLKLAAESCVAAGRRCLRLFANTEAAGFAKRGMKFADKLDDPDRTRLQMKLTEVKLGAVKPEDLAGTAGELEKLAEHALDLGCHEHARLGFHMAAWLRWEGGEWGDAQRQMMRAEVVSRDGDEGQRALAMGEAARCLALLERDLSQAEALLLEARAMAQRSGVESPGMLHAAAMLRLHEGREEEASKLFERAQSLARSRGDRQSEFQILEHRLLLALDRGAVDGARGLVDQLMDIGVKLRGGSEAPAAAAMQAVVRQAGGEDALEPFERDAEALRTVDAKQHLLNALLRMGEIELKAGEHDRAARRAEESLKLGEILQRPSDIAQARLLMLRTHEATGDTRGAKKLLAQLKETDLPRLSARVRRQVEDAVSVRGKA